MHCFLATFHQKEYCFECQWWMMRSRHARLDQNIFNHIKWWFQFPLLLSILRVSDWHLKGFTIIGRQLLTCSTHSILFSLHTQKEVLYMPVFSVHHSLDLLSVPVWHAGFALFRKSSHYFVKRIASRPWLVNSKLEFKQNALVNCWIF